MRSQFMELEKRVTAAEVRADLQDALIQSLLDRIEVLWVERPTGIGERSEQCDCKRES